MDDSVWDELCRDPHDERSEADRIAETTAAEARDIRLRQLVRGEQERREALRIVQAEELAGRRRDPVRVSLRDELELPDEDELYAIDGLLPLGGNGLFAARYKAGKTIFAGNLLKAWVDGEPYLGMYRCRPDPDRPVVTIFNYEMSRSQFRRWLRNFGIVNQDLVHVVHLRGIALTLGLPDVRDEVAGWLRDARTGLWIVDPASRAMAGMGDGSDNKDVNEFTAYLDEIKAEAGVRDMLLNIHMGHAASQDKNAERALGAQAWSAWADALWFLKKDDNGQRYFKAYGRDVDVAEMGIRYDPETMRVTSDGMDSYAFKMQQIEEVVIALVRENPGINVRAIRDQGTAKFQARQIDYDRVTERLVNDGRISTRTGARKSICHYLTEDHPTLSQDPQP